MLLQGILSLTHPSPHFSFCREQAAYAEKFLAAVEDELCFREKSSWKIIGLCVSGILFPSWFVTLAKSFQLSVSLFLSPLK